MLQELLAWWNLIFLLPFVLALLTLLATAFTGLTDADGDAEGDADGDGDAGGDGDGDAGDGEAGAESHDFPAATAWQAALHTIGFGTIPFTLLLGVMLLVFGMAGVALNRAMSVGEAPGSRFPLALLLATLLALAVAALFSSVARRYLPKTMPATGNKDLVGRTGKVLYLVTENEGTVQVRDASGTVHQVAARVRQGLDTLPAGTEVLVVSFDADRGAFMVEESPF